MRLSVLIVNWNTRDLLRDCLRTVLLSANSQNTEILVVDNASTDGSADMVQSEFPQVKLILPGTNTGYAKGNNLAFAEASGEYLLTLNPDTELELDTLEKAMSDLDDNPNVGCVAGKLIGSDGETQASVRGFPTYLGIFGDLTGLGKRLPGSVFDAYRLNSFDYEVKQEAPQPMGTFLMFRRESLQGIGDPKCPFDEYFPIFFNEVDLLYRLKQSGRICLYDPSIRIKHLGGASTKQVRISMIWESHRSLLRFFLKHRLTWWNSPVFVLFSGFVWLGAFVRAKGVHAGFRP